MPREETRSPIDEVLEEHERKAKARAKRAKGAAAPAKEHAKPANRAKRSKRIEGVVLGALRGFSADGAPLVDHAGAATSPVEARAACALEDAHVGRAIALMFEGGDPAKPIVVGPLHAQPRSRAAAPKVTREGKRVVIEADDEIVLRCGDASITLTSSGKVLLKGAYLSSRSKGINRIVGGSVLIN